MSVQGHFASSSYFSKIFKERERQQLKYFRPILRVLFENGFNKLSSKGVDLIQVRQPCLIYLNYFIFTLIMPLITASLS